MGYVEATDWTGLCSVADLRSIKIRLEEIMDILGIVDEEEQGDNKNERINHHTNNYNITAGVISGSQIQQGTEEGEQLITINDQIRDNVIEQLEEIKIETKNDDVKKQIEEIKELLKNQQIKKSTVRKLLTSLRDILEQTGAAYLATKIPSMLRVIFSS